MLCIERMKILVTGGAGFIGTNLVRYLVKRQGVGVVNVDKLTYAGNLHSLADLDGDARYEFEQVDLCDASELRAVFARHDPSCVMHLAAESHVDRSIDGPGQFIETNIVGTFQLLQVARSHFESLSGKRRAEFRFLHVSTDEVFGSLQPEDAGFSESTPYDPHSPYSASKAASDHLARAWKDTYGLPVIVTNCSNNYGPYQFPEKLIPVVLLNALRREAIPVYGTGENVRDWLYVGDHVEALYCVLRKGSPGETYNIGGDNERRNIDLVRSLCAILDEERPRDDGCSYAEQIKFVQDRPGHDLRYAIDAGKIRRELGWIPSEGNESGLRKTVRWYLENQSWVDNILTGGYRLERMGKLT